MSTFGSFTQGLLLNLKFSTGLVLGWMTTDGSAQTETRYALYANGRILQSEPVPMFGPGCHDFAPKGRKWLKVQSIPESAEFIGNYPPLKA